MTRWLALTLFCTGAGGCAGERPQFGTMRTDDATGDAGSDQKSASSSETHPTASGSINTIDASASPTKDDQDSSTGDHTSSTGDHTSIAGDDSNGAPDSSAPAATECSSDEFEACNDCGQRSCDEEAGVWGPCLPAEEPRCHEEKTGLEVCNGSGNWETQECTNPDPTNCTAACAVPDGVAACVVSAIDADGDGYLSAACEAAPEDDCDDTTQSVSPGSFEACDGRDNDCDGYTDTMDSTVSLAGSPATVSSAVRDLRRIDIAWRGPSLYFVADGRPLTESGFTSVYSGYIRADGSTTITEILTTNHSDDLYDSPRLAAAGDTLGATVRQDGRHSYGTRFLTLDATGTSLTDIAVQVREKGSGAIGHDDSSFTIFNYGAANTAHPFNTVSFAIGLPDGSLTETAVRDDIPGELREVNVAQGNAVTGAVYTDVSEAQPRVRLLRWSEGNILGPTELSASAQSADIAALASGQFAVAWATAAGFRLQVRATNGTLVCDSEQIAFGNGVLDALDSVAVAESNLGIVVAVADSGTAEGQAAAFIFNDDCEPLTQTGKDLFNSQLVEHRYRPHAPRIAVGGGNIAFAWTAESSGSYRSYVRVMPEAMCE